MTRPFYIPTRYYKSFRSSSFPPATGATPVVVLFTILTDVQQRIPAVLISISLLDNHVGRIFMCLSATCVFGKMLLHIFADVLIVLFAFFTAEFSKFCIYILDTRPLPDMGFAIVFF